MIVLDGSAAILLAKADLLEGFLLDAGRIVWMPGEAQRECRGRDSLDARVIARAVNRKRILVKAAGAAATSAVAAEFGLGSGEAAAIVLASPKGGLVATDDKRAINACKVLGLPFTTALSVLVRMREKVLIGREAAAAMLEILMREGRYKKEIIDTARWELEK